MHLKCIYILVNELRRNITIYADTVESSASVADWSGLVALHTPLTTSVTSRACFWCPFLQPLLYTSRTVHCCRFCSSVRIVSHLHNPGDIYVCLVLRLGGTAGANKHPSIHQQT